MVLLIDTKIHYESEGYVMNCLNCYQEIPDGTKFCPYCGARQTGYTAQERGEDTHQKMNVQPESPMQPETQIQPEPPIQCETDIQQQMQPETDTQARPEDSAAQNQEPVFQNEFQTHENDINRQFYSGEPDNQGSGFGQSEPYRQSEQFSQNNVYGQTEQFAQGQFNQSGQYNPGMPQYGPGEQRKETNWVPYLILSIISTLCCCIPLGIIAIIYSAKISSMTTAGKGEEAHRAAKTARIWIIAAFAVGILFDILAFVFVFVAGVFDGYYGGIFDIIYHLRNMV